jgi:hypothetical protein
MLGIRMCQSPQLEIGAIIWTVRAGEIILKSLCQMNEPRNISTKAGFFILKNDHMIFGVDVFNNKKNDHLLDIRDHR